MMTTNPNATEADEVAELRRLTMAALIDALKAPNPKASMLAVAVKFLGETKDTTPPHQDLQALVSERELPFPAEDKAETNPALPRREVPFPVRGKVDGGTGTDQPWQPTDNAAFTGPEFNAPKLG